MIDAIMERLVLLVFTGLAAVVTVYGVIAACRDDQDGGS